MAKVHLLMKRHHTGIEVVDRVMSSRKKVIKVLCEAAGVKDHTELTRVVVLSRCRAEYHVGEGRDKSIYWINTEEVE